MTSIDPYNIDIYDEVYLCKKIDTISLTKMKKYKKIIFGIEFNSKIDNLPNSIRILKFTDIFNQSIDKLPSSLLKLSLSYYFNHKCDNLPETLVDLSIEEKFTHLLNNLPNKLLVLRINNCQIYKLFYLPNSLTHLIIHTNNYSEFPFETIFNYPSSIIEIIYGEIACLYNLHVSKINLISLNLLKLQYEHL